MLKDKHAGNNNSTYETEYNNMYDWENDKALREALAAIYAGFKWAKNKKTMVLA